MNEGRNGKQVKFAVATMMAGIFTVEAVILKLSGFSIKKSIPYVLLSLILLAVMSFGVTWLAKRSLKKKNTNIPSYDERDFSILKNYLLAAFYVILLVSSIIVLMFFILDVKTIETPWLAIYLGGIFVLLGVGTLLAKRFG